MKIAVLCPSRDNPVGAERAFLSMIETSQFTDMILCIDHDQEDLYATIPRNDRLKVLPGPRTDIVGSVNRAVSEFRGYDIYGLVVDDATFLTRAWDQWLAEAINSLPKRLGVVSAFHNLGGFVNFAYVSREWIDLLGWYACPDTQHFCWDTVLEMIGEATAIRYATESEFAIFHDSHPRDEAVKVFCLDAVQFLGWCVNKRRDTVTKIREAMAA